MEKLFFLLSGEHPELPAGEVKAILEAHGLEYRVVESRDQLLILEAPQEACEIVARRAALCFNCGRVLFESRAEWESILESARGAPWNLIEGKSFAVRVKRVKGSAPQIGSQDLQRLLGDLALRYADTKVSLEKPDVVVQAILTEDVLVAGMVLATVDKKQFLERRPRGRPFFHPGVLSPKASRVFVNLARACPGELLLDPFCGTGGFLIEAAMIGCTPIGVDIDERMVKGALRNMRFYELEGELLRGDARKLPFTKVDAIATDPPYGRSASTKRTPLPELYRDFLEETAGVLPSKSYLVVAAPSDLDVEKLAALAGFRIMEKYSVRVHKSLTRVLYVLVR